jgi:Flp pilus assembly protein TadB
MNSCLSTAACTVALALVTWPVYAASPTVALLALIALIVLVIRSGRRDAARMRRRA